MTFRIASYQKPANNPIPVSGYVVTQERSRLKGNNLNVHEQANTNFETRSSLLLSSYLVSGILLQYCCTRSSTPRSVYHVISLLG